MDNIFKYIDVAYYGYIFIITVYFNQYPLTIYAKSFLPSFIMKKCCVNVDTIQMNNVSVLDLRNANLLQNYG